MTTDTTPLAPCPFCGCPARPVKHSAGVPRTMGYDQWHGVSCTACNACVGASDRRFRAASEAAAAWNRRAPQQAPASGAEFALSALVAAGHVSQDLVDRAIALPGAPQPVAREPLTDDRLREIERMHVYAHTATLMDFARAIERAHGITPNGRKDGS